MRPDPDLEDCHRPAHGDMVTVLVERDEHGGWSVALPERQVTCETLDDARRIAYLCVAHTRPCELIVRDAYHRVLHRELIDGDHPARLGARSAPSRPQPKHRSNPRGW